MAQRRMFSLKVIDTDSFLDMSPTAQLLYFHLSMRADDDGFVSSPKKIMKMANVPEDDMRVLIAKKYIIPFESGICVIKDWKIHNYIQADRYQETQYLEEKNQISQGENGEYLKCIQNVSKVDTQVRLGKDRLELGKVSEDKDIYGEHKNVKLLLNEYENLVNKLGEKNTQILIEELSTYMASKGKRYASHYATIQTWARMKIQKHQERSQGKNRTII